MLTNGPPPGIKFKQRKKKKEEKGPGDERGVRLNRGKKRRDQCSQAGVHSGVAAERRGKRGGGWRGIYNMGGKGG